MMEVKPHWSPDADYSSEKLRFICSQEEKLKKFEEFGIDNVIVIPFTKEFASTPSDEFVKSYIIERIHPAIIVVGYDHHFGKNRMGDFGLLNDLMHKYNFRVERIAAQDVENIAVSSTKIRHALSVGPIYLFQFFHNHLSTFRNKLLHEVTVFIHSLEICLTL